MTRATWDWTDDNVLRLVVEAATAVASAGAGAGGDAFALLYEQARPKQRRRRRRRRRRQGKRGSLAMAAGRKWPPGLARRRAIRRAEGGGSDRGAGGWVLGIREWWNRSLRSLTAVQLQFLESTTQDLAFGETPRDSMIYRVCLTPQAEVVKVLKFFNP